MHEAPPNLSELSVGDKDALIVRLFAAVEDLQTRVTLLEAENQALRSENQELRGKLAKNSQNSSKPPSINRPFYRRLSISLSSYTEKKAVF